MKIGHPQFFPKQKSSGRIVSAILEVVGWTMGLNE
jgi:hypothetical protein